MAVGQLNFMIKFIANITGIVLLYRSNLKRQCYMRCRYETILNEHRENQS